MSNNQNTQNLNSQNKAEIVNAALYIDALKSSGYKSTYNAIAEIVDNSIDAEANNIFIIGNQSKGPKGDVKLTSFAFLDDGKGMDFDTLRSCLTIGYTTNQARKGMGRFGVGLPQASIFVCNRVEIYSWQNGIENCQKVYLDVEEIKNNKLNEINPPIKCNIPEIYKQFITWNGGDKIFDFTKHGTLVIWTNCTNVDHRKWPTCVDHMSEDLGRKYRYFLKNNTKHIRMIELQSKKETIMFPNDPLYLMTPSQECAPSDLETFKNNDYVTKPYNKSTGYTECLFEIYKSEEDNPDEISVPIEYEENGELKTGEVKIKYSVIKDKYYSKPSLQTETKPGALNFGKSQRLNHNIGISIVRNGREIDFGSFGFYNSYNVPDYRWWGIEISFKSDLDHAFGISNNKQSVNLKPLSKQEMEEYSVNDLKTVWHQLADEILPTINNMTNRNSEIRGKELITETPTPPISSTIVNTADKEDDTPLTEEEISEEKKEEAEEQLINEGNENPTKEQIQKFIDSRVRVKPVHNKSALDSFIDYNYSAGTLSIILNANHSFYKHIAEDLLEDENKKTSFELFLIAVMKSIKNLATSYPRVMNELTYDINKRITSYMIELDKNSD